MSVIKVERANRLGELMEKENISTEDAALLLENLNRRAKAGDEIASFMFKFDCHPLDGGVALKKAIDNVFGFSFGESTFSLFEGNKPPTMVEVAIGTKPEDKVIIPWGVITLPGVEGTLTPMADDDLFVLICSVKRKNEEQVKVLAAEIGRILKEESIYRGKAVRLDWKEMPFDAPVLTPEFLPLSGLEDSQLILNQGVRDAIEINLFTPIEQRQAVKDAGIEWRRSVMLSGGYGTGKTLTAAITAAKAEKAGITFAICDAGHLDQALQFGRDYAPSIIFCEDVDERMIAQRTVEVNTVLNELDGVASKDADVMVVFTTNSVESITKAALRPGRCDAVIEFELPDARTTELLVRAYAGASLERGVDISAAVAALTGNSPAVIAEAAKRARLAAIRAGEKLITPALLSTAVQTMRGQIELLRRPEVVNPTQLEKAAVVVGKYLYEALACAGSRVDVQAVANAIRNGKEGQVAAPWANAPVV